MLSTDSRKVSIQDQIEAFSPIDSENILSDMKYFHPKIIDWKLIGNNFDFWYWGFWTLQLEEDPMSFVILLLSETLKPCN